MVAGEGQFEHKVRTLLIADVLCVLSCVIFAEPDLGFVRPKAAAVCEALSNGRFLELDCLLVVMLTTCAL